MIGCESPGLACHLKPADGVFFREALAASQSHGSCEEAPIYSSLCLPLTQLRRRDAVAEKGAGMEEYQTERLMFPTQPAST